MKRSRPATERSAATEKRRPKRSAGLSLSELAKKNVTEKRTVSESLGSAARNLVELVSSTELTSTLLDASRNWDTQVNEMIIVARLGLAGVEGVRLAHNLLPKQYGSRRNQLAAIIVNSFLPPTQQVSEADCGVLLSFMEDRCSDYCNLKSHDNLQQLSLRECLPFEEFLAPPVDICIVPECRGRLVDQHKPIAVTIYGLTGPRRATKLCLRCSKCNTVYNYSQYGRKHTDGEKLYNHRREYIEVSDAIYCERQLHELFCNLR